MIKKKGCRGSRAQSAFHELQLKLGAPRRIPRDPSHLRDRVQPAHTHKCESVCLSVRQIVYPIFFLTSQFHNSKVLKNSVILLSLKYNSTSVITKVLDGLPPPFPLVYTWYWYSFSCFTTSCIVWIKPELISGFFFLDKYWGSDWCGTFAMKKYVYCV